MKELTIEALREILVMVQSSKEFVIQQAPGYAQELVRYELWSNGFYLVVGVLWLIVCGAIAKWCWGNIVAGDDDYWPGAAISVLASSFSIIPLLASIIPDLLKALAAPKVLIVEHLLRMMK